MAICVMTKGKPDSDKKSCYDCKYCESAISWWCMSDKAYQEYKTRIPGRSGCKYWKPVMMYKHLNFFQKLFSFLWIGIEQDDKNE